MLKFNKHHSIWHNHCVALSKKLVNIIPRPWIYHSHVFIFLKVYLTIFETYDFIILRNLNNIIIYAYNSTYSYVFTLNIISLKFISIPSDNTYIAFSFVKQHRFLRLSCEHVYAVLRALIRFTTLIVSASGRFYRWPRLHKERTHIRSDFFIGDAHLTHHMIFYKYDVRLVRRKFYTTHFVRWSRRRIRLVTFDFGELQQYANNLISLQPENVFTGRGLIMHGVLRRQKKGKIEKFY